MINADLYSSEMGAMASSASINFSCLKINFNILTFKVAFFITFDLGKFYYLLSDPSPIIVFPCCFHNMLWRLDLVVALLLEKAWKRFVDSSMTACQQLDDSLLTAWCLLDVLQTDLEHGTPPKIIDPYFENFFNFG